MPILSKVCRGSPLFFLRNLLVLLTTAFLVCLTAPRTPEASSKSSLSFLFVASALRLASILERDIVLFFLIILSLILPRVFDDSRVLDAIDLRPVNVFVMFDRIGEFIRQRYTEVENITNGSLKSSHLEQMGCYSHYHYHQQLLVEQQKYQCYYC